MKSKTPFDAVDQKDDRPQRGAWAPGEYFNHCAECKQLFLGDKRAGKCAPCAYGDEPNA